MVAAGVAGGEVQSARWSIHRRAFMEDEMMKRYTGVTALVVAALVVTMAAPCLVQAEQAKKVTLTGVVSVSRDDDEKVTSISLFVGETQYSVTLDKKGLELADLDGKKVEATGTLVEKDKVKTLTVQTFKEIEEEEDWGDGGEM
jgi:hypothetical protein